MSYLKTYVARRTQYQLKKALPEGVTIEQVQDIVQQLVKNTPTSFNSQTVRAVVITGDLHNKVWQSVADAIPTDAQKKRPTSIKDEAFGSVIFFDESAALKKIQDAFPAYADYFPIFASTSNGAAQINTWALIGELGLGGHLQHYNQWVESALKGKVPESWNVVAQLAFGIPVGEPDEKTFIENEVKVLSE
jgi:predicted oxidoreductase (fatty acid repression mutant protein)